MSRRSKSSRLPPAVDRLPGENSAEEEARLFAEEMRRLGSVPDKDQGPAAADGGRTPQRLKIPRRRQIVPDDRLDLHGKTVEEARLALDRFVAVARGERLRVVLVVTGKGLRSAGGTPVLKRELERWVRAEGAAHVRAYGEAPRALGGAGAYLLYLL